jgi:hypothetical protein
MDCLVTKLKGTVNDDSLLPLGGMFFKAVSNPSETPARRQLILISSKSQVVTVVGGDNNFTKDSSMSSNFINSMNLTANESNNVYCKDGNYNILVPDKYSLVQIGSWTNPLITIGFNLESIKFSNGLKAISASAVGGNVEGDLSNLAGLNLRYISIGKNVYGDIKVIDEINWSTETNIGGGMPAAFIVYSRDKKITGNITSLTGSSVLTQLGFSTQTGISGTLAQIAKKFPKLTYLDIPHTNITGNIKDITCPLTRMGVYDCAGISGSLEQFVATQRSHGRTAGTCSNGGYWTGNITFNGTPLGNEDEDEFSWTASQITCGETTVNA